MYLILAFVMLSSAALANAGTIETTSDLSEPFTSSNHSNLLLGHNVTPTSYTLGKNQLVAGPYYIGYGLTDQLMIATSPWVIAAYNMPMVDLKYGFSPSVIFEHASAEFMYFKTAEFGLDWYHQESTWLRFTGTNHIGPGYDLHTCLGIQYFIDAQVPFSLRPPPTNNTPLTISLTQLNEFHLSEHWGTFIEWGVLGVNYPDRFLHLGASIFYQWKTGYLQAGASKTFAIGPEYINYGDVYDHMRVNEYGERTTSIYYLVDEPIHPEIQLEFLL